nr:MAG TPA: hypothetical protein [Caudoviricetes sp.]
MGVGGAGHQHADLSQLLFTFRLLSTQVGCLLATGGSRAKAPVCVTTMLVRVVTLFTLQQDFLSERFVGIATNSPCCSSCDGMGSVGDFGPVCYTRVDESSKTICGVAAEEP